MAPIDDKGGSRNKFDPEFLRARMYYLQEFMNAITEHPELRLSPHLYIFLKSQDGEQLEKAKKDLEKVVNPNSVIAGGAINKKMFYQKNPIKVEHLVRVGGSVECKIDSKLKDLHTQADIAIKEWIPVYTKCKTLSRDLTLTLALGKSQADNLAAEIEALQKATCKFNDYVGRQSPFSWGTIEAIYATLADSIKGLGMLRSSRSFLRETGSQRPRMPLQHLHLL